jgi:hypothetical protein
MENKLNKKICTQMERGGEKVNRKALWASNITTVEMFKGGIGVHISVYRVVGKKMGLRRTRAVKHPV